MQLHVQLRRLTYLDQLNQHLVGLPATQEGEFRSRFYSHASNHGDEFGSQRTHGQIRMVTANLAN